MSDIGALEQRIDDLEAEVEQQADRIETLEDALETERQSRQEAQPRIEDLETTVER